MSVWIMGRGRDRRRMPWLATAGIGLTAALVGCAPADGEEVSTRDSSDTVGVRIVNVEVTPVALSDFVDYIRVTGEVEALHDVVISAEEVGTIERFYLAKGRAVRRGQVIAKINDAVLRAQADEARAAAQLAKEQFERQRRLWEEEQIGSEIVYLQTKSAWEVAAARRATLEARLARTEIRAPVSGIFDEKYVEAGEMVSPGTPVVRVVSISQVKIVAGVPERYAVAVRMGATARVTLDVLPDLELVGRISYLGASADPSNRTVPIEIVLDNPGRMVKPQMVADVQIVRERLDSVITVSQEVVLRTEAGYQVYLVESQDGQDVAQARPVELGPAYGNRVVIQAGLAIGDRVVTLGQRLVDHGSRVRIVSDEGSSDE